MKTIPLKIALSFGIFRRRSRMKKTLLTNSKQMLCTALSGSTFVLNTQYISVAF